MRLSVLSVAFPFAAVSPNSVGGAEQILSAIDEALTAAGQQSIVLAQDGSVTAGELVPTPHLPGNISGVEQSEVWKLYRLKINEVCAARNVDVIHCHGIDYHRYL